MPRTARASAGGLCYHVINRGNAGALVYRKPQDYQAFLDLVQGSCDRLPMRVVAYCLMPNHFHLVLWPSEDGDLSRWMQWLLTSHVRRYHGHYGTSGHVWQGRFKAFPIQQDGHLLVVMRYVERNALRAGMVARAEAWPWSSLRWRGPEAGPRFLTAPPVGLVPDWPDWVNATEDPGELGRLRECVNRGRPFGREEWVARVAVDLGLEASTRPRGRPAKGPAEK